MCCCRSRLVLINCCFFLRQLICGWTRGVQVKLWNLLRTHVIAYPSAFRGVLLRQGAIQIHVFLTLAICLRSSHCNTCGVHYLTSCCTVRCQYEHQYLAFDDSAVRQVIFEWLTWRVGVENLWRRIYAWQGSSCKVGDHITYGLF